MAGEWRETTLGECADWLSGGTPFKGNDAFWSGPIPWVSAKDMKSFRLHDAEDHISALAVGNGGKLVPGGTILLLVRGMTLHNDVPICMITREMAFNQDIKAIRPAKNVDGAFLAYWLLAHKPDLLASVDHAGHGTGRLITDTLKNRVVHLPPLAEQNAIAAVLGALDDKIELNRRMNATLEAMARALFQSWFVDFDPVRAKLHGRKPDGLDKPTAALFPASFQDSPLGPIPRGWRRCTLREIAKVSSGGTPAKGADIYWNGSIPWISPKVMTRIHVDDSGDHVSDAAIGNGTRLVPKGTVLVMVRGMGLHQGVRISQAQRDVTFNQDVKAIAPKTVPSTFLLYGLLHAAPVLLSKVHASGHGTGVLSTEFLDRLSFAIPPADRLPALAAPLGALNVRIAANHSESRVLAALRDALLPELLSGSITIAGHHEARSH